MSTPVYTGGPAFPTAPEVLPAADGTTFHRRAYENCDDQQGMSLRDYFAAQALVAELTARGGAGNCNIDDLANDCYLIADTILLVRKS